MKTLLDFFHIFDLELSITFVRMRISVQCKHQRLISDYCNV